MRCDVSVDARTGELPLIGTGAPVAIRKSKRSQWRAGVLIGVHVLAAAHIAHFMTTGRSLSPVEPSESAYTIEAGYIRAGTIFFVAALLGTLIFGRFFCGWGCHVVALQDLCGWVMKKLGVRPRPFRSRFMAFAPLAVALYMFAWPTVRRLLFGNGEGAFSGFTNHLMTDNFWQTFPGPLIGGLTFVVCGFAAVYFLGAKGFCTYGCPYGALFGPIDTLSIGRIVVSDACEQCGHCTATCTSNVRVHEEVRLHGMVVDPGCMKCTDCISVCPKGALRFAFARPALFRRAPTRPPTKRFDLPLSEELLVGAVCLLATLTFFRLYDGPPLLMAVGLGGLTAFASLELWHLVRRSNVRMQNLVLESAGTVRRSGWLFVAIALLWLTFTAHSGFVQWHRTRGLHWLNRTETSREDVLSRAFLQKEYSPRHYRAVEQAFRHLSLADRWGFASVMDVKLALSWADMLRSDLDAAAEDARRAVDLAPGKERMTLQNLFEVLLAGGRISEDIETMRRKIDLGQPTPQDHVQLALLFETADRLEEAAVEYRACVSAAPGSASAHRALGDVLRRLRQYDEARDHLRAARELSPGDARTHVQLGLTELAMGANGEALQSFKRALELQPELSEFPVPVRRLMGQLERGSNDKAPPERR